MLKYLTVFSHYTCEYALVPHTLVASAQQKSPSAWVKSDSDRPSSSPNASDEHEIDEL